MFQSVEPSVTKERNNDNNDERDIEIPNDDNETNNGDETEDIKPTKSGSNTRIFSDMKNQLTEN